MTTFLRVLRFAFQNFWRNFWLSLVTVSMMAFTLITVNMLIMLTLVGQRAVAYVQDKVEVSVYFNADVPLDRVQSASDYLRSLSQVRDVSIITPDQALAQFQARHAGDPTVLKSLDELGKNPFGPTLVVKANDPSDFPVILAALDTPQYQKDIRDKDYADYQQVIDNIQSKVSQARVFGGALAAIFLLIATLIVFNAVRMGIVIHREEIGIMKLVGASNAFVRAPFLVESLLCALLGTLIAVGITLPAVAAVDPALGAFFDGAQTIDLFGFFTRQGLIVFGGEFLGLAFVGLVATGFAMRKYLKV
jgi:cell division transport system permease protein